ncbi:uncharacterized protein Mst85C [Drosophila tropicalis]|uniref:uncharacterized protein Mst85C n=1 Tax=Drosophila tropicalis TaxID=46794 RepID=UPI0035ABEFF0
MQSYGGSGNPAAAASTANNKNKAIFFPRPATPWDGMPWACPQPDVGGIMHFGSNANTNYGIESHKRKSLEQLATVMPPKMLITEERITQHFSGLQISGESKVGAGVNGSGNNNSVASVTGGLATDDIPSTSTGKTHHPNPAYQLAAMELEQKLRNANRIVICDELKQSTAPPVAAAGIPPEWLIKSVPRPCTALVPWQPPPHQLPLSVLSKQGPEQQQPPQLHQQSTTTEDLDDYDDDLEFFENNNTCNVNLNKSDEQMDEDL